MGNRGNRGNGWIWIAAAVILVAAVIIGVVLFGSVRDSDTVTLRDMTKPVIYLYPEKPTDVHVGLSVDGTLIASYPEYPDGGWDVTAYPDGTVGTGGRSYRYLFWEAESAYVPDFSEGFCVSSDDALAFLESKLSEIGLTDYEAQEMIVYWLPVLKRNGYSLVSFQTDTYTEKAVLDVTPEPDSVLRVFMAVKALDGPVEIEPQSFAPFERDGFVLVEWGGTVVE